MGRPESFKERGYAQFNVSENDDEELKPFVLRFECPNDECRQPQRNDGWKNVLNNYGVLADLHGVVRIRFFN